MSSMVPCVPEYWPARQHFRGKDAHSADPNGWFFAVFKGRGPAVYTTMEQVEKCIKDFEGPLWAQAATWEEILRKWEDYCVRNHSHVIDISSDSSDSTVPSTPATRASSPLDQVSEDSFEASDDSLFSDLHLPAPAPPSPTSPSRLPPSRPLPREEPGAALNEAAAIRSKVDVQAIAHMAEEAEATIRRIDQHAERAFGFLQNAGECTRLIGQETQHIIQIMSNVRASLQGAYPLHPFSGHRCHCQMSDLSVFADLLHVDTREDVDG